MIKVYAYLKFYPTEDDAKLKKVLRNLFEIKDEDIEIENDKGVTLLKGTVLGINAIMNMFEGFRKQRTVQSARKFLMRRMMEDSVSFMLNKQALYVQRFHFCDSEDESPMGPVWVKIESDNIERLLNYLVPETKDGHVLEVNYIPS